MKGGMTFRPIRNTFHPRELATIESVHALFEVKPRLLKELSFALTGEEWRSAVFDALFRMRGYAAAQKVLTNKNVDEKMTEEEAADLSSAIMDSGVGTVRFLNLPYEVALKGGWGSKEEAERMVGWADAAAEVYIKTRASASKTVRRLAEKFEAMCARGNDAARDEMVAAAAKLIAPKDIGTEKVQEKRGAWAKEDMKVFSKALGLDRAGAHESSTFNARENTLRVIARVLELRRVLVEETFDRAPEEIPSFYYDGSVRGVEEILRRAADDSGEYMNADGVIFSPAVKPQIKCGTIQHTLDGVPVCQNRSIMVRKAGGRVVSEGDSLSCSRFAWIEPLRRSPSDAGVTKTVNHYSMSELRDAIDGKVVEPKRATSIFFEPEGLTLENILSDEWRDRDHLNLSPRTLKALSNAGGNEKRLNIQYTAYKFLVYFCAFETEAELLHWKKRRFALRIASGAHVVPVKARDFTFAPRVEAIESKTVLKISAGRSVKKQLQSDHMSVAADGTIWVATRCAEAYSEFSPEVALEGSRGNRTFRVEFRPKKDIGAFARFVLFSVLKEANVNPFMDRNGIDVVDGDTYSAVKKVFLLMSSFDSMNSQKCAAHRRNQDHIGAGNLDLYTGTSRSMVTVLGWIGFSVIPCPKGPRGSRGFGVLKSTGAKDGSRIPVSFKGVHMMGSPLVRFDEPLVSISTLVRKFDFQGGDAGRMDEKLVGERIRSAVNFLGKVESTGTRYRTFTKMYLRPNSDFDEETVRVRHHVTVSRSWGDTKASATNDARLHFNWDAPLMCKHYPPTKRLKKLAKDEKKFPSPFVFMVPTTPDSHIRNIGVASRAFAPADPTDEQVACDYASPLVRTKHDAEALARAIKANKGVYRFFAVAPGVLEPGDKLSRRTASGDPLSVDARWEVFSVLDADFAPLGVARAAVAFRGALVAAAEDPALELSAASHCFDGSRLVGQATIWTKWARDVDVAATAAACAALGLPPSAAGVARRAAVARNVAVCRAAVKALLGPAVRRVGSKTYETRLIKNALVPAYFADGNENSPFVLDEFTPLHNVNDFLEMLAQCFLYKQTILFSDHEDVLQAAINWVSASMTLGWTSRPIGVPEILSEVEDVRRFADARNSALAVLVFSPISEVMTTRVTWGMREGTAHAGEVVDVRTEIRHHAERLSTCEMRARLAKNCESANPVGPYLPGCLVRSGFAFSLKKVDADDGAVPRLLKRKRHGNDDDDDYVNDGGDPPTDGTEADFPTGDDVFEAHTVALDPWTICIPEWHATSPTVTKSIYLYDGVSQREMVLVKYQREDEGGGVDVFMAEDGQKGASFVSLEAGNAYGAKLKEERLGTTSCTFTINREKFKVTLQASENRYRTLLEVTQKQKKKKNAKN